MMNKELKELLTGLNSELAQTGEKFVDAIGLTEAEQKLWFCYLQCNRGIRSTVEKRNILARKVYIDEKRNFLSGGWKNLAPEVNEATVETLFKILWASALSYAADAFMVVDEKAQSSAMESLNENLKDVVLVPACKRLLARARNQTESK